MDLPFRIEKKESFRTVGYKIQTTNRRGEGRKAIPALWTRFKTENLDKPLQALSNQKQQGLLGFNDIIFPRYIRREQLGQRVGCKY